MSTQSPRSQPRPRRVARTVVSALVIAGGVAGFAFFGFLSWLRLCGISGCSGGGFGRSTDPAGTRLTILLAAGCLLAALLVRATLLRSLRTAGYAVVISLVAMVALAGVVGSDWRGCPRSITHETCLAERR